MVKRYLSMKEKCGWVCLMFLLNFCSFGSSFKHQLWLNKTGGEVLYFNTQVSDASDFYEDFMDVEACCVTGKWYIFEEANFTKFWLSFGYITNNENMACAHMNFSTVNSFRHWGASDTKTDAVSLYFDQNYTGDEILVTEGVYENITMPVQSLTATGTSSWTFFEGQNLDGKSLCYHVPKRDEPTDTFIYNWDYLIWLEMETIGSLYKGCNPEAIQAYKESQLLIN